MQDKRNLLLPNGYWTCKNLLHMKGISFADKLIQQLLQSVGCGLQFSNKKRIIMMRFIMTRVYSKWIAYVSNEAAKEAEELCASGQCATALVPLQRAINLGHLSSRALMAWLHINGREGVSLDQKRAFKLAKEGARLGCHHCQGVMACCYRDGYGIRRDEARSLELARESSRKGSRYGQYMLGQINRRGVGLIAGDYAKSVAYYRLAAAQNLDGAQWSLGLMNYEGRGVNLDLAEALRLFQLAAAQGHPPALYWVAECHEYGRGVGKNKAEAIRLYRRALAAGCSYAAIPLQSLVAE
jgi:TPR repeat protein